MSNPERVREMFDEIDKDDSGGVDFQEMKRVLKHNGYSDDHIQTFFGNMDENADQKISEDEFMAALAAATPEQARETSLRKAFLQFDADGSGSISRSELDEALTSCRSDLSDDDVARCMACADQSGDGVIDYEEFLKMVASSS